MNQVVSLLRKLGLLPEEEQVTKRRTSASSRRVAIPAVPNPQLSGKPPAREGVREPSAHDGGRRSTVMAYQSLWLQELVRGLLARRDPRMAEILEKSSDKMNGEDRHEETRKMITRLVSIMKSLALEFNNMTLDIPGFEVMRLIPGDLTDVKEQSAPKPYGVSKSNKPPKSRSFIRFRVSTQSWCLSLRGHKGRIEFYLVPASELFVLSESETPMRLRNALILDDRLGMDIWTIDGLPAETDELYYLCRALFKNLLFASAQDLKEELDSGSLLQNLEGDALKTTVRELLLAEQNMAQKIVSQQEDIQNRIARDLHDAVIADLMTLKRSLAGDAHLSTEAINSSLDDICQRIREICHDLTPRDLRDWGLQTVIEDLLERVSQRTGADCSFECVGDLPEFPFAVQLHLFRIVQESLNNIEKYAQASRVTVRFEVGNQIARLTMSDDGTGYDMSDIEGRRSREGGSGLSGIRERAEMIRCFYPTKLRFESAPGRGSVTVLEMRLSEGSWLAT